MGEITINDGCSVDGSKTLVCIDGSYLIYHALFSAINAWKDSSPYSDCLNDVDVTDPDFEQVDLTRYPDFVDALEGKLSEDLVKVKGMVADFNRDHFSETYGDMLFVMDPEHGPKSRSWRYQIYPEYKGQRRAQKDSKPYDVYKAFEKSVEIVRDSGKFERRFGMRVVSADRAEADDIIATVFTDPESKGMNRFLVASDRDYLQLEGVTQMNMFGDAVLIEQPYPDLVNVTPGDYLIAKIITGDTSDNITQVFPRVGYKTAVKKFVTNLEFLNESLENDPVAMAKFTRNKRLIDFGCIPKKIRAAAREAVAL